MNKPLLLALIFSVVTIAPAAAMPKVAESESAPVTLGADAPKPKKSSASNANPAQKKSARQAKSGHRAKHGKAHR